MPTPIIKPRALIYQEFSQTPVAITKPFRAHLSGPVGYLVRYDFDSEKPNGDLGAYDPLSDASYLWPTRPAGALVDESYTKLFLDKARLLTFRDLIGDDETVLPVSGKLDRVRIGGAYGFKANGSSYPRFPALFDRDVQLGDKVKVRGAVASVTYEVDTYVRGIVADQIAASIGTASPASTNHSTQSATSTATQVAGPVNCNTLAASLAGYDALMDGAIDDIYTIRVVEGSVDGDLSTARLRVTTASGFDDDLDVTPGFVDDYFAVGGRGLLLKFTCVGHSVSSISTDDLVPGQIYTLTVHDNYTALTATSSGTFTGTADTLYVVTCSRGGLFAASSAADRPQLTITTTSGTDNGGPVTVSATGTDYPVGTKGVLIHFGSGPAGIRKGDTWYIQATAATDGRFSTLVLGRSLPAALAAGASDLDLTISLERSFEVPANRIGFEPETNWTQSATELSVSSGMLGYDPSVTSGGILQAMDVLSGSLFVQYRAWRSELCGIVTAVTSANLDTAIPGPIHPDNPLKYAAAKAIANSNGVEVKITGVCDPDSDDSWADVLALITGLPEVYGLVPLTSRLSVLQLYAGHVNSQSTPENACWRALWAQLTNATVKAVVTADNSEDGGLVLGTISDDPDTSGTQYTYVRVPAGNGNFVANQVRPGDTLRFNYGTSWGVESYDSYVVDAIVNEDTIRLVAGPPAAVTVARKLEIWRTLGKDAQVEAIGSLAATFGNRRVCAVWPDTVGAGGLTVPGYHLCAALAGLRSGVVPHQGLTNAALTGFDDLSRTSYFNETQLDQLAGYGVWIVGADLTTGEIVNRHAITTDISDIDHREEMVRVNIDSVSYTANAWFSPFVGKANVSDDLVTRFKVELEAMRDYLRNVGRTDTLGSQISDFSSMTVEKHPYLRDRIVMTIVPVYPIPLNYPELHIVI